MSRVRAMIPSDYPEVAAMAANAAHQQLIGRPVWTRAAEVAAEVSALPEARFVVAEDTVGKVIGFTGYTLQPDGEALLYGPLVQSPGGGVGAWLIARVESMASQQGASSLAMLVGLENRSGAAWAEWRGYHRETEFQPLLFSWLEKGETAVREAILSATDSIGSLLLRPAVPADLERIAALLQLCFPHRFHGPEVLLTNLHQYWVLEMDKVVIASTCLDQTTARLGETVVEPELRRHGLGSRLVLAALHHFWQTDCRMVCTAHRLEDLAASEFVRSLGFGRAIPVAKWRKR